MPQVVEVDGVKMYEGSHPGFPYRKLDRIDRQGQSPDRSASRRGALEKLAAAAQQVGADVLIKVEANFVESAVDVTCYASGTPVKKI